MDEMKNFYEKVLEMEMIEETDNSFSVMAGTTKLVIEKAEVTPFYHFCFRTGTRFFMYMYQKLAEQGVLLPNEEGEYSFFWKGKQAYFTDPDGNILELLERTFIWGEEYQVSSWYDIGEVGLPVNDVSEMQRELAPYIYDSQNHESATFAFHGDSNGVLVIVKQGRHWYPTNREATIHPIKIIVSGEEECRFSHKVHPYEIVVRIEWENTMRAVQFRIARPTNQLAKLVEFYMEGLGLKKIGEFRNHEGYDGVMLGLPNNGYHLGFTQAEEKVDLPIPTMEHLLVFYLPNRFERDRIVKHLRNRGYKQSDPENPYWARGGVTIEDPDGWRIVLMNTAGI